MTFILAYLYFLFCSPSFYVPMFIVSVVLTVLKRDWESPI